MTEHSCSSSQVSAGYHESSELADYPAGRHGAESQVLDLLDASFRMTEMKKKNRRMQQKHFEKFVLSRESTIVNFAAFQIKTRKKRHFKLML